MFTTAASGSSSTLVTEQPSTAGGKGESSQDLVGSALLRYRGVLNVTLGASGKVELAAKGKGVRTLKAGRYDLALDDRTSHGGLRVRRPNLSVVTLTGAPFVGKRITRLALRPGTWLFTSDRGSAPVVVSSA